MYNKNREHILQHLKRVAVLPWEMLEIYFHAVLRKMLLKSVSCVLKIERLDVIWLNRY